VTGINGQLKDVAVKVPAVTLGFWVIKILATTLGETAGDTVSMSMDLGYLVGMATFIVPLVLLVVLPFRARRVKRPICAQFGWAPLG